MLKKRLIPCLFLKNGHLVRSERFEFHQLLGDPVHQVDRINAWSADELIYVDISNEEYYDLRRDDMRVKRMDDIYDIIAHVSKTCFIPLTFGGNIKTIEDVRRRLKCGADKVIINTQAHERPEFVTEAAEKFGSQCIVIGIDVKKESNGVYHAYSHHGRKDTLKDPVSWAKEVEKLGAGEIFLNSIDRDGVQKGYDLAVIKMVVNAVKIPVIACGGAGTFEDIAECVKESSVSAVAAGNIFNYTENAVLRAKKTLIQNGIEMRPLVRPPSLFKSQDHILNGYIKNI